MFPLTSTDVKYHLARVNDLTRTTDSTRQSSSRANKGTALPPNLTTPTPKPRRSPSSVHRLAHHPPSPNFSEPADLAAPSRRSLPTPTRRVPKSTPHPSRPLPIRLLTRRLISITLIRRRSFRFRRRRRPGRVTVLRRRRRRRRPVLLSFRVCGHGRRRLGGVVAEVGEAEGHGFFFACWYVAGLSGGLLGLG